jgi:hypothetical protein
VQLFALIVLQCEVRCVCKKFHAEKSKRRAEAGRGNFTGTLPSKPAKRFELPS